MAKREERKVESEKRLKEAHRRSLSNFLMNYKKKIFLLHRWDIIKEKVVILFIFRGQRPRRE
jgi:hypothetical protein